MEENKRKGTKKRNIKINVNNKNTKERNKYRILSYVFFNFIQINLNIEI